PRGRVCECAGSALSRQDAGATESADALKATIAARAVMGRLEAGATRGLFALRSSRVASQLVRAG
ncbi:MAG TPA: hypothetical protein VF099_12730, partial [Ktedonobacterales bacterium]